MLVAVKAGRFARLEELDRDANAPFRRGSNLFELTWQARERERGGESGSERVSVDSNLGTDLPICDPDLTTSDLLTSDAMGPREEASQSVNGDEMLEGGNERRRPRRP